jgi:AcrR family transcriptional regulator
VLSAVTLRARNDVAAFDGPRGISDAPAVRKKRAKSSTAPPSVGKEVRERILSGAARAFGKLGYASTRVEDVLQAAEVSRPTFYKAYSSKDDVFDALSERHHRDIRERIVRASDGTTDPIAQLLATIQAFMRWRAELGPIGRVLDTEARTPGSRLGRHRKKTLAEMTALTGERMRAVGRGPADPVLYYGLIAAMESVADMLLSTHPVAPLAVERATRNAFRILGGALAEPGDAVPPLPAPPRETAEKGKSRVRRQRARRAGVLD